MCVLLRHSCDPARMLTVSVARQRILIYPASLSQPFESKTRKQSSIRPSHSIFLSRSAHEISMFFQECVFSPEENQQPILLDVNKTHILPNKIDEQFAMVSSFNNPHSFRIIVTIQQQTNHQPPTTNHQPPTTDHRPPTTDHRPPTTDHRPPTTDHRPPHDHRPPTTDHRPPTTDHRPPNTEHRTPNTEHRTPNTEHQTPNTKHQTPNTTTTTMIQSGEAPLLTGEEPPPHLWGVETCSHPSRRPNPIPAILPYVVRTPHLHGAPTSKETVKL